MLIDHEKILSMKKMIVDTNEAIHWAIEEKDIIEYVNSLEKEQPQYNGRDKSNVYNKRDFCETIDKTKIKDYRCKKCKSVYFYFKKKDEAHMGIYCKKCNQWLKWADKNEKQLMFWIKE